MGAVFFPDTVYKAFRNYRFGRPN